MKVLTYDRVRVETGFAIESLRELEVKLVPGKHGTAWIRGFVDEEIATAKLQSQLKNSQVKVFEVDENGAQVGKPIFEGIVRDAEVGEENGYTEVKINAVTDTILLDMEKKSRSFQDVSMTYRDVVKKVLEDTSGAHAIFTVGMDTKIEKPLIQFEETDWQFMRRLVSHFSSELIPEVEMCRPNFWFGMRESSATADFSDNMYDVHIDGKYYDMGGDAIGLKRADYLYYSVVDGQNLSIGDLVTFRDKSLIIGEKYAKFERGELLFHYKLCRPAFVGIKPYYNEKVCGLSLPGTVRTTKKEVLYIDLDIDKEREKGVLYPYAWVPTTGNLMYCMPKIGTRVFLYIPDHDERHAMSTSCIRTNGKQHPQMADYHNRYFTTEHFKQMNMLPESMALIGVGEQEKPLSITMHDSMGISVFSHKTIVLRAGNGISISGKNVIFKTQRDLRVVQGLGGTAKIEICNKIDVDAPKTSVLATYHSASGRPQEKPSPDESALAKVLMFVMGAAMITCVTATAGLGPVGLIFGAMAARVMPRITTGSGQIMMVTGAAVPALVAEALKLLAQLLAALKNKLLGPNPYWPYTIYHAQGIEEWTGKRPANTGKYPEDGLPGLNVPNLLPGVHLPKTMLILDEKVHVIIRQRNSTNCLLSAAGIGNNETEPKVKKLFNKI